MNQSYKTRSRWGFPVEQFTPVCPHKSFEKFQTKLPVETNEL